MKSKLLVIFSILNSTFILGQSNCDLFDFSCIENEYVSGNYFYELEIDDCETFSFSKEVDKQMKEGLINKIITKIDLSSSLETSNIEGQSKSTFTEKISFESSGILFDINYIYCNNNNSNLFIAYVNKNIFNNSSRRSFQNKLILLNSKIDLLFDQLIFNNELIFENDINDLSNEIRFMDKNLIFLNNIDIEYDLVYAFDNLKSKFGKLKLRLKTFENMKNELMNYLLNSNIQKAKDELELMKVKFGKNSLYKKELQNLKKLIRKN
jgi:hypothetical protein